jgi:hypothetical protein
MELATKLAWAMLALIHLSPAAVALSPGLARRLYGVAPGGDMDVLIQHRGWLFLAVFAVCIHAAFDPDARHAASVVTTISLIGFLAVYVRAGAPSGPLRKIALVDAVGLAPLAWTLFAASALG